MSNENFAGRRAILERVITIDSAPDRIFPLLCPVREGEWVDGWVGKSIHSSSGYAEENGVFATGNPGEDDTIWFVTRRDSNTHQIEFVTFVPRVQVFRLYVQVTPLGADRSNIAVRYIRTGISEAGNEVIRDSGPHFDAMMSDWERTLNHYVKTGELMKEHH